MSLKHHKSSELFCRIDATAVSAIMVMLVFLMLFSPMLANHPHSGAAIDLPRVHSPISMWRAGTRNAMVVALMRDGKVFFGRELTKPEELSDRIRLRLSQGAEPKVYIKADARAKYGWVKEVLDEVRSSGVEKIGFLVDQGRPPTIAAKAALTAP